MGPWGGERSTDLRVWAVGHATKKRRQSMHTRKEVRKMWTWSAVRREGRERKRERERLCKQACHGRHQQKTSFCLGHHHSLTPSSVYLSLLPPSLYRPDPRRFCTETRPLLSLSLSLSHARAPAPILSKTDDLTHTYQQKRAIRGAPVRTLERLRHQAVAVLPVSSIRLVRR